MSPPSTGTDTDTDTDTKRVSPGHRPSTSLPVRAALSWIEGWLVAIRYRDTKSTTDRLKQLPTTLARAAGRSGKTLHYVAIDGRRPLSASKIR